MRRFTVQIGPRVNLYRLAAVRWLNGRHATAHATVVVALLGRNHLTDKEAGHGIGCLLKGDQENGAAGPGKRVYAPLAGGPLHIPLI